MSNPRIKVTLENENGRNIYFRDNRTGVNMDRIDFVDKINNGYYPNYHVRNINGIDTPCSNPDSTRNNNLG